MASSFSSSPRAYDEYDFADNDSFEYEDDRDYYGQASDEDTEDASETDMMKKEEEYTEIKEQMYKDKLAQLKKQLQQLEEGTLPEYLKRLKKLEQQYKERVRVNEVWYQYQADHVEKLFVAEKKASVDEFEQKKVELKENLIAELEDKKRMIENEKMTMELTGGLWYLADSMEVKPVTTRKLRRRPNEPVPMPEKRKRSSPNQLNFLLDDSDIMDDLKIISKISGKPLSKKQQMYSSSNCDTAYEARIDDGKLYYDKRWFHKGQPVHLESKESGRVSGVISSVGSQEVWIRKITDNSKIRVYVSQLQKGKFTIRRRST
ncbi:sin3 histone deacetylase corepressor complex component SDS3 isoform X2 [Lingula anatina]|uniref:Sin3 histone deacetylase corepressor complex component SDS3 isoform X2 n=1 Tax=Lingula anatina TaxID=7574 RepID=A0A1S3HK34_LINAN|nr:sin3 histone deacetylase corepressor complex component SDS3 isoform X2 [Lingula anatina]|eukprot:XP_013385354.1 sin3 histone deacetylase corepressor complex component SDS3 isoform X2 [Lingula anatina]